MLSGESKKIADGVIRIFCFSILWMGIGLVSVLVFLPLVALEYEVSGTITGLILCTPYLTSIFASMVVPKFAARVGIELTICTAGICFGLANIVMGFAASVESQTSFIWIAMLSSMMIGFSSATNIVGEQALLLRYTIKQEREKNLGKFRASEGLGGLIAPLLGAAFYAWGGFMAVFMYVGAGFLILSPLIYR